MTKVVSITGIATLGVGIGLLIFTFVSAFAQLKGVATIPVSGGLVEVFGEALAPLIEACIRAVFLGIMGWVGSILSMRGVQILTAAEKSKKAKTPEEGKKGE